MALARLVPLAVLLAACSACGDDGPNKPVDAPPVGSDIDNGSCGDMLRFTGEYVDWDFDANSCGIFEALFQVQGDGAMDSTAPNGRFDLCIPSGNTTTLLDVTTEATANSNCTDPLSPYPMAAIAVARKDVLLGGGGWSGRNMTTARRASFFQDAGLTYEPTKAQVHVHVTGTPRAVSIAAAHEATQALSTTTWAPGDTGQEVFFPNVDVGGGTTMLTVTGGAIGTGEIPLAAGKITTITVVAD